MTTSSAFTLICARATDDELATAEQLLRLLRRYGVSRWRFTSTIQIVRGAIPHSHPTLTLSTRHLNDDGLLEIVGTHEATRVLRFWRGDHYRAIYAALMDDTQAVGEIVMKTVGLP